MLLYLNIIALLISLALMYKIGRIVVESAVDLSHALKIGTFTIGFLLVSIGTTLPEIFVSSISALEGAPGIAVGNAVGSSLANITLITALAIFLAGPIHLSKKELRRLLEVLFLTTLISAVIYFKGELLRMHGIVLIILFGYFIFKIKASQHFPGPKKKLSVLKSSLKVFFSALSLAILAEIVVRSTINLSQITGLPNSFIGITIIAVGTSLPELVVLSESIRRKEYDLGLGDIFGASIINLTLVLGISAILGPKKFDITPIGTGITFLIMSSIILWYLISKSSIIDKRNALFFFIFYLAFILQELGFFILF
jgi:cation:H+ antiporter